jgi:hypothetical protein
VGFARSYDPESYAGGSLATGRASHARQVKGDGPDKNGYPGPPGWRSVRGRNSKVRQSYLREQRPCRSEMQVFLAREVVPGKVGLRGGWIGVQSRGEGNLSRGANLIQTLVL